MGILKKLLPLLVLLLAALALLFGVGWLRPAQHIAACRGVLRVDPDQVWARVVDVDAWPTWVSAFDAVRPRADEDGHPSYFVETEFGEAVLIVEQRDSERMVTFLDAGSFEGRWAYELSAVPAGSQLTITETGTVSNPLMRGLMMFMDEHASMRGFLEDLGAALECDVSVTEVEPDQESVGERAGDA